MGTWCTATCAVFQILVLPALPLFLLYIFIILGFGHLILTLEQNEKEFFLLCLLLTLETKLKARG